MELKVGNYARTKNKIIKINQVIENGIREFEDDYGRVFEEETGKKVIRYIDKDGWNCGVDEDEILKVSENIIDLIEVGDYVNGKEVMTISGFKDGSRYIEFDEGRYLCKNYQIKSIVTKEQFNSVKYEVE